jgi:biopolymer transport protein ExbD
VKVSTSTDKYEVMAEINMVPFIDIALVLLIIFMIMTPFLVKEQIKINLPKTKAANTPVDASQKPIQIDVTSGGQLYVNGEEVSEEQIFATVKELLVDPATQPVVIAADKGVVFEKVVIAMDAAKRCGAKLLGISASQDKDGTLKADAPAPAHKPKAAPAKGSGKSAPGGGAAKAAPAKGGAAKPAPAKAKR